MNPQTLLLARLSPDTLCLVWMALALGVFIALQFVNPPYGRHAPGHNWGPGLDERLGWLVMELPSLGLMAGFLILGSKSRESGAWVLFALWLLHYVNRSLIFPARMRRTPKQMPLLIILMGIVFNGVNAGLNGWYLGEYLDVGQYTPQWFLQPLSLLGFLLFAGGFLVNQVSDTMLIRLRRPGETGYTIPRGFLFEFVAAPNLLGEVLEWLGFALLARNPAGWSFFVWTSANLIPRAKAHLRWYQKTFGEDWPKKRKAIIPFLY